MYLRGTELTSTTLVSAPSPPRFDLNHAGILVHSRPEKPIPDGSATVPLSPQIVKLARWAEF